MGSKRPASLLVFFTRRGRESLLLRSRTSAASCRTRMRPLSGRLSYRGTCPRCYSRCYPRCYSYYYLFLFVDRLSDRIAYFLGTHGPSLTIETACSSSLVALTLAVNAIRDGSCDVAIVSAVNVASREYELALQATGVISRQGECRPFDEDASGTLRCEGQACMVICSMNWAKNHGYSGTIKSVIVNSTIGSAGADPTVAQGSGRLYESPNVFGMAEMIRLCHEQVGLPLEKISYVEAHGALFSTIPSTRRPWSSPTLTLS